MIANERITEKLVRDFLNKNDYFSKEEINVEEQKSKNELISNLLNRSSKKGTSKSGSPEFIITSKTSPDLVIIIECKFNIERHSSKNLISIVPKNAQKFAVDGALWYASFLKQYFNIICIGVSGTKENYRISKYRVNKYEKKSYTKKLNSNEIWEFDKYLEKFRFKDNFKDDFSKKISDGYISNFADEVNNILRDNYDMDNYLKPILVSTILIGMDNIKNRIESNDFFLNKSDKDLFNDLKHEAIKKIEEYSEEIGNKIETIKSHLEILEKYFKDEKKEITLLHNDKFSSDFANMIKELYNKIYKLIKDKKYTLDPIGIFYSKLLKYATGEGKNLGIILTPNHITDLFSDLANDGEGIKKTDILIDTCAGSGGFLISAYKKMISQCNNNDEITLVKVNSRP